MSDLVTTVNDLREARQHISNALKVGEGILGPKAEQGLRECMSTLSAIITYPVLEIADDE